MGNLNPHSFKRVPAPLGEPAEAVNSTRMYCSSKTCRFEQRNCFQRRFTCGWRGRAIISKAAVQGPSSSHQTWRHKCRTLSFSSSLFKSYGYTVRLVNATDGAHFPHSRSAGLSQRTAGLPRLAIRRPFLPHPILLANWILTACKYNRFRQPATEISIPWQSAVYSLGLHPRIQL